MRKALILLTMLVLLLLPLVAQGQTRSSLPVNQARKAKVKKAAPAKGKEAADHDGAAADSGVAAARREAAASPSATGADQPSRARRFWVTAALSAGFDTNITHDEEGLNSFGVVPSFGVHFRDNPEKPSFEADYEVALHRYTGTAEFNRVSHYLTTAYRRQLARRWYARTTGEMSLKGSSDDRDINNQYTLEQQLQYRLNSANRVSVFAAYRIKRYPLIERGSNAVDSYIGGKFERRLRGGRGWEVGYRYDKNRTQDPRDRYIRWTYNAEFHTPLFRNHTDLLTVGARYRPRLYARQIKVDGERVARHDGRWVFDVLYERALKRDVQLAWNYRYEARNSNDPDKKFASHQFGVTFAFNWWK